MLKIRLQRIGRRNDPSYRVVVTDSKRGPKSNNYKEILGSYDTKRKNVSINGERVKYWISVGAQVSDTVHNLLINQKIIKGSKVNVLPKKVPIVKESAEDETADSAVATPAAETPSEAAAPAAETTPATDDGAAEPAAQPEAANTPTEESVAEETEAKTTA